MKIVKNVLLLIHFIIISKNLGVEIFLYRFNNKILTLTRYIQTIFASFCYFYLLIDPETAEKEQKASAKINKIKFDN